MKFRYRFSLFPTYDFKNIEDWLEHQSESGLHLNKYGQNLTRFTVGEPESRSYKIEFIGDEPSEERLALYAESGWSYVSKLSQGMHIFSAMKDEQFIPLHTDAQEESIQLKRHLKAVDRRILTFLIIFIIWLLLKLSTVHDARGFMTILALNFYRSDLIILLPLYSVLYMVWHRMKVKRIISELENNTHSKASSYSSKGSRILKGLILPALIPMIILSLVPITPRTVGYRDHFTLSAEEYEKLPFVHLSDVIDSDHIEEHYFSRNTLLTKSIHQLVALEVDADISGDAAEKLNSTLYELRFGILAKSLMKEIMTESSPVEWSPAENKSFDALYYRTVGRKFEIIGSKGSVILESTYIGSKDQRMVLEHYVRLFSAYLNGE